jgi:hypothetical protein
MPGGEVWHLAVMRAMQLLIRWPGPSLRRVDPENMHLGGSGVRVMLDLLLLKDRFACVGCCAVLAKKDKLRQQQQPDAEQQ